MKITQTWCWLVIAIGVLFIWLSCHERSFEIFYAWNAKFTAIKRETLRVGAIGTGILGIGYGLFGLLVR